MPLAISLFGLLQFPLAMFAMVTSNLVESIVSLKRISDFLKAGELQADARQVVEKPQLKAGDEVSMIMLYLLCPSAEARGYVGDNYQGWRVLLEQGRILSHPGRHQHYGAQGRATWHLGKSRCWQGHSPFLNHSVLCKLTVLCDMQTSLLSAICGDMTRVEGQVKVAGSIAYAPQNPWIMSATVR